MNELELLGSQCLQLLGNAATVTTLEHLRQGPASTREIIAEAPGTGYRTLMTRVQLLAEHGLVGTGRELRLLTPGHAALSVIDVAAGCEAEWLSPGRSDVGCLDGAYMSRLGLVTATVPAVPPRPHVVSSGHCLGQPLEVGCVPHHRV